MSHDELASHLVVLRGSVIDALAIDLLLFRITLTVKDMPVEIPIEVSFEGVSAFALMDVAGALSAEPAAWHDIQLQAVHFDQDGHGTFYHVGHPRYPGAPDSAPLSSANFVLVLEHGTLFIEAKSIVIGQARFDVGYPILAP